VTYRKPDHLYFLKTFLIAVCDTMDIVARKSVDRIPEVSCLLFLASLEPSASLFST
jgi:hypothetical protein